MIEFYNNAPPAAQYILIGVALLLVALVVTVIIAVIMSNRSNEERIKVPKTLPLGPVPILSLNEGALYSKLMALMRRYPGNILFPKVATSAIVSGLEDEHPKIKRAIAKSFIHDAHDYLVCNDRFEPILIIEYNSTREDKREHQAEMAGIRIVRIDNAHHSIDELEQRVGPYLKR